MQSSTDATKVVVVTGSSSGIGDLTVRALARAGHRVFAGMRESGGRNAPAMAALRDLASSEDLLVEGVEMDVQNQASVDAAIESIVAEAGRLDVVVHNAGHMVLGPTEAFTPDQLAQQFDVNVLSTQRVNRAVLPLLRAQGSGLVVWVGSSSTRGGHPPFLAPYFAAKAAMDALAESYAAELIRFGVDSCIVVPGAYPSGTNHFAHAGTPDDAARAAEYDALYAELRTRMVEQLAAIFPAGHTVDAVADAITRVVDLPMGQRPFRVHVDPSRDGSEVVSVVFDRIRAEFFRRIGVAELLSAEASL